MNARVVMIGGAMLVILAGMAAVTNLAAVPRPHLAGLSPEPSATPRATPSHTTLADQVAVADDPARWAALLVNPMSACATGSSAPADVAAMSAQWRRQGRLEATVDPDCFRDPKTPQPPSDQVDGVPLKVGVSLDSDDVLIVRRGYTVALTCRAERAHEPSERSLRFAEWPTDARYWYTSVAVSAVNGVAVHGFLPITAVVRGERHVYSLIEALPRCPGS